MDFYVYFIMLMYMYMAGCLNIYPPYCSYIKNSIHICKQLWSVMYLTYIRSNHEQSATPYVAILLLECVIDFKHVHKNTHHCCDALSMEPLSHPDLTSGGGI